MRKILSVLLALLFVCSLAACSQKEHNDDTTVSTEDNSLEVMEVEMPEDFVLIQGGTFQMGSPDSEAWRSADETQHTVTVSDFYMSKYELTQKEYEEIMGTTQVIFRARIYLLKISQGWTQRLFAMQGAKKKG